MQVLKWGVIATILSFSIFVNAEDKGAFVYLSFDPPKANVSVGEETQNVKRAEIIDLERKKKDDAESKIRTIEESLEKMR